MQLEDGEVGPGAMLYAKWLLQLRDPRVLFIGTVRGGGRVRNAFLTHSETALVLVASEARIMAVSTVLLSSRPSKRSTS
jgi:hypothetical protein